MSTLAELTTRVQMVLQDRDAAAWQPQQIRRELHHALLRCARQLGAQELLWVQATQGKTHYALNEQALTMTAGSDTSGAVANATTLTDSGTDFIALGVETQDRIRNLTDGSVGVITSGLTTTLTCAEGFTGGAENVIDDGDVYIIERPLDHRLVLQVHTVLYNGIELWPMTAETLDRLAPGWETQATGPKYWSVDQATTPSVVQVHPAPLMTGSSVPNFPMQPLAQRWQENFVLVLSESPEDTIDAEETFHWLDWYEDMTVFDTVGRLTGFPGQWQNLPVSAGAQAIAQLYRTRGAA